MKLNKIEAERLQALARDVQTMFGGVIGKHHPLAVPVRLVDSPISLPPSKSGKYSVRHRRGSKDEPVIGMRQALLRGIRAVMADVSDRTIHELWGPEGKWMSDSPEELFQIYEMLSSMVPCGKVFVGGLGLGILPAMVAAHTGVELITVCEISPHVIKLCSKARQGMYHVHCGDMYQALAEFSDYDYYLLDTWQGTGEMAWWTEVMPARRIIRRRFGVRPVIHCWAEDIMAGQVVRSLMLGKDHWYYRGLPAMTGDEANNFLQTVGLPQWEARYGKAVDANAKRYSGPG